MRGTFRGVGSRRLISALLFAALSAASHADYAIVVGVQHYPNAPGYAPLEGPVPDSKALSEVLALRFGFKVRTLLDADATKERILNEIKIAASSIGEDERFVFYFAGHGMMSPPSLMPADAVADDPSGKGEYRTITPDELYAAVRLINARSRTVILDSCHSGAMSKGLDAGIVPRLYIPRRRTLLSKGFDVFPEPASGKDLGHKFDLGKGEVCYVTACRDIEKAYEARLEGGQRTGLFTHFLMRSLQESDEATPTWEEVRTDVSTNLSEFLTSKGYSQSPTVSSAYREALMFESKDQVGPESRLLKSAAQLFATENPDPTKLSISIQPDTTNLQVGQFLRLKVSASEPGYLVVLGQIRGRIYPIFPKKPEDGALPPVESVKVEAGHEFNSPDDPSSPGSYFDLVGQDQVKAFLFKNAEHAAALLESVSGPSSKADMEGLIAKVIALKASPDSFFTSALVFSVSDALIGGTPLADPTALLRRLVAQQEPATQYLMRAFGFQNRATLQGLAAEPGDVAQSSKDKLAEILNLMIQTRILYDPTAFQSLVLSIEAKRLLELDPPAGSKERIELNRMMLEAVFPAETGATTGGGS